VLSAECSPQVGIEDCLHIEFEYDRTRFHLTDVVKGHVNFLLVRRPHNAACRLVSRLLQLRAPSPCCTQVRIRIKFMELAVVRKEAVGAGAGAPTTNDTQTLTRFEIMDGCPVRGETVPIRMFLAPLDLSPSAAGVANGMLSVRYFLNLVLVDGACEDATAARLRARLRCVRVDCSVLHLLSLFLSLSLSLSLSLMRR
jgi:vacuolar protein sorting-associated protein 26